MTQGASNCCALPSAAATTVVDVPVVAAPPAAPVAATELPFSQRVTDMFVPAATPPTTSFIAPQPVLPEPMPMPAQQQVAPAPQSQMPAQQAAPVALPEPMQIGAAAPQAQPKPGTAAWLTTWPSAQAQLQQLGLPKLIIDAIGREPMTQRDLNEAVQEVAQQMRGRQQSSILTPLDGSAGAQRGGQRGTSSQVLPPLSQQGASAPATQQQQQQAQLQQQVQRVLAKHAKSGMPKELLQAIEQNASSPRGLDATLTQLEGRMDKLRADGWVAKYAKAGVDEAVLWQLALGGDDEAGTMFGPPPKDDKLALTLTMLQRSKAGMPRQLLEAGISLIPGVQAAEYLVGKNVISNSDIRRKDGINQLLAGASAVALGVLALGKFRSFKSMLSGLTMAREGYQGLQKATGRALADGSQAARLSALAQSGKVTPFKAFFNKGLRNELIGMGHVEAAAQARAAAGTKLDRIGATMVDDVLQRSARGQLTANAGKLTSRSLGRRGVRSVHNIAELSEDAIAFNRKLRIGNGTSQLAAITKASGERMVADPTHLAQRLPALTRSIEQFSSAQRSSVGNTVAGMTLAQVGKAGRDGAPVRALNKMLVQDPASPALAWYREALKHTRP